MFYNLSVILKITNVARRNVLGEKYWGAKHLDPIKPMGSNYLKCTLILLNHLDHNKNDAYYIALL